jgi:uncharacterized protein (TIGR02996 family)
MTEQALHRAIIESTEDDLPRLVYADWLDEHGQPERAEFIRVQVELARLAADNPVRKALESRERDLLAAKQDEWLSLIREAINDYVFHRGMLGVGVSVNRFLNHAQLLTECPLVCYIDIADHAVGRDAILALAGMAELARVTILNLAGWYCYDPEDMLVDDEQAVALASSPYVSRLECLNLRCNAIGNEGAQAIATSPHFGRLRELDLRANLLGDEGVRALANSSSLSGLVSLDLSFNDGRVSEGGWRFLAEASGLPRLKGLGLGGNRISSEVQAALRTRFGSGVCC